MPEFREDKTIWPVLVDLLGCIQAELEASGLEPLGRYTVANGSEPPALDGVDCDGYAWTRLVDAYPSTVFPNQDATLPRARGPLAHVLEVAVARCVVIGDEENPESAAPIDPAAIFEDARIQLADKSALYRAICKCLADREFLIGNYVVNGPLGGMVYSGWSVTVGQAL